MTRSLVLLCVNPCTGTVVVEGGCWNSPVHIERGLCTHSKWIYLEARMLPKFGLITKWWLFMLFSWLGCRLEESGSSPCWALFGFESRLFIADAPVGHLEVSNLYCSNRNNQDQNIKEISHVITNASVMTCGRCMRPPHEGEDHECVDIPRQFRSPIFFWDDLTDVSGITLSTIVCELGDVSGWVWAA